MKANLQTALKEAMKARDQIKMDTIRSILSAIQYEEMQKGVENLSPDVVISIVKTELKKRNEELEFFKKADRGDDIQKLAAEIKVLETFLPSQLSADQLEKIIVDIKSASPAANVGVVMKALKETYNGQYDGKLASELVKKVLG